MKEQVYLFASAIAGLLAVAGNPAAADPCLTQPNPLAGSGHWYYRIDQPTHRKCWYQQTSTTGARAATSSSPPSPPSPPSSTNETSPLSAKSSGLNSWLPSVPASVPPKAPSVAAQDNAVHDPRSAESAREPPSRWRGRTGDADRSHSTRTDVEPLHAKQVNSDNSQAVRAQSDSRRLDVDSTALRVRREDQDSIRVQGGASSNASALSVEPEVSRVRRANQENATVGQAEPDAHARGIGQENSRTQAIKTDDARAAGVDSDDPPLNRFDWDGARNAVSSTRVDRLLAVPTLAEPPTHKAVPQAAVPASVKPGVSALDATQREALFQEFLRWQERQGVRWIGTSSTR